MDITMFPKLRNRDFKSGLELAQGHSVDGKNGPKFLSFPIPTPFLGE
jgi:hypothetical protein